MKTLYGETKINEKDSEDIGKKTSIKLKYYKIKSLIIKTKRKKYGIEIVKEELNGKSKTKERTVEKYISNSEQVIEKLLKLLVKNKVTPVTTNDIITALRKCPELIYNPDQNKE